MSGAAIPIVGKIIAGAVVGKVVGKVTGNEKLGMMAALATGSLIPGGAITAGAEGAGGLLSTAADFAENYPHATTIGTNLVGGATQGYMTAKSQEEAAKAKVKAAEKEYQFVAEQVRIKREHQSAEAEKAYDRTHQGFSSGGPGYRGSLESDGLLTTEATVPTSAADEYYQKFSTMYGRGVR